MKYVTFSGDGQGNVAHATMDALKARGDSVVSQHDADYDLTTPLDVAICTTGGMRIGPAEGVTRDTLDYLHEGNYALPRSFIEGSAQAFIDRGRPGLIIVLGSNAGTYGNPGAEDYAAYKAALKKYCEVRRRTLRDHGIRLAYIGFGGIDTAFWVKATAAADPELCKTIVPGSRVPLSTNDAVSYILALIDLPDNVAVTDALVLSTLYQ